MNNSICSGEGDIVYLVLKGCKRQSLFQRKEDYRACQRILLQVKKKLGVCLYAYCMDRDRICLLAQGEKGFAKVLQRLVREEYEAYARNHHRKQETFFQEKYCCEAVMGEEHFWTVLVHVHGMACKKVKQEEMEQYPYSSYREYVAGKPGLADVKQILESVSVRKLKALHKDGRYKGVSNGKGIRRRQRTEEEAFFMMCGCMDGNSPHAFAHLPMLRQAGCIVRLKKQRVTYAQISRMTGIPYERIRYLARCR